MIGAEPLPDGAAVAEESVRGFLIQDDRQCEGVGAGRSLLSGAAEGGVVRIRYALVRLLEFTAREHRLIQNGKKTCSDGFSGYRYLNRRRDVRVVGGQLNPSVIVVGRKGRLRREGKAGHRAGCSEAFGQDFKQSLRFFWGVAVANRIDGEEDHRLLIEMGLKRVAAHDSQDEEAGDEQQHQRSRNLRDHCEVPDTEPSVTGQRERRAFFEGGSNVHPGCLESGYEAESNAAHDGENKSKNGRVPVDGNIG